MVKNTKAYDSMYKSIDRFIRYSPDSARAIDEYFIECDYLAEIADDGVKIVMKTYDWSLNRYLTTIYDDLIVSIANKDKNDRNDYKNVLTRGLLEIFIIKVVDMENTQDYDPEDVVDCIEESIRRLGNHLEMAITTKNITFNYIMAFMRYSIENISKTSNVDLSDDFLCVGWFSRDSNIMCVYSGDLC